MALPVELPRFVLARSRAWMRAARERWGATAADRGRGLPADPEGETQPARPEHELAAWLDDPSDVPTGTEEEATASQLLLAQATIGELRGALERLRPIADELAETERARLALEARLEELDRAASPDEAPQLEAELARTRELVERRDRRIEQLSLRLERLRARFENRDRTASERWHELVRLRRELKGLRAETDRRLPRARPSE